ncbi:MAG: extensin family protein [Hyphomicrobiales bacterium]|nr:extensin family protein [Hyphomicrobiales bacterium]
MARCVRPLGLAFVAASLLVGCGFPSRPERPVWRAQAENACFARNLVIPSQSIVPAPEIDGPGVCGMTRPLKVSALASGTIGLNKTLTIDCPMIPALEAWLSAVVQPAAEARFGQKVAAVNVFGAYSCRSIDNIPGERLSEHAFGNAVDVSGFTLADGRTLEFVRDWKKVDSQEAAFLHAAHAGACQYFTTVLGPGADMFHYNHIHLDLANHGATDDGPRRICKPRPSPDLAPPPGKPDGLPPAPEIEEPLDISRLGDHNTVALAPPSLAPGAGPDAALPPAAIGETDPAPPILPAGAGPSLDAAPTSSLDEKDE